MKSILKILVSVAALALTLTLVTGSGLSEAWAKDYPGQLYRATSSITQPGNTQGSPGASSSNNTQDVRKSGGNTKSSGTPFLKSSVRHCVYN